MTLLAIVAALIALFVVYSYNAIVKHDNAVKRAWANVHNYQRQKVKILDALTPQVSQYADHEKALQTRITELRGGIGKLDDAAPDAANLQAIEAKTDQLLKGLSVTVENYPDLKANTVFLNLMGEITAQNENVGAAISIFNRNVERFNARIKSFPHNLVNAALNHKRPITEFSDPTTASDIDYRPEL